MARLDLNALISAIESALRPNGPWSAQALSKAAGGHRDLVRDILRGKTKEPNAGHVVGLARALDRDLKEFVGGAPEVQFATPTGAPYLMKVTGAVAAGVWLEQTDWPPEEQYEVEVYPLTGAEGRLDRMLLELRGLSMNKTIPPNSVLDCVRIKFTDVAPQPDDIVIVERKAHDLTEMTCKRLKMGPEGWELHCESTQPEFQDVIKLGFPDPDLHIDNEIEVIGIVLEARQNLRRRRSF